MGGVTRAVESVSRSLGLSDRPRQQSGAASAPAPQPAARVGIDVPSTEEMDKSSRRRARRGARALLSEARLNPEEGVGKSTLGTGPM